MEESKTKEEEGEKEEEERELGEMESEGYKENIMEGIGDDDKIMLKVRIA